MGVDAVRIRVQIRRFLAISIRTCYRSIRKHPFLVGLVCCLIFLYRSFPLLFSLLVSASPVLVCTAILLGTLLSFGEPNIPEIGKEKQEEEVSHEVSCLKEGAVEDATVVVERDESFCVERFVGKIKDLGEKDYKEENLAEKKDSRIEDDDGLGDHMPLVAENSREIQFEKQVIEEVERESNYLELGKKGEIHKDKEVLSDGDVEHQYSLVQNVGDEIHELEDDNLPGEFIEAKKGERLDSSWKRANEDEEEEEEDDEVSDSGSDGAESSSPDASMADIIPILDELHPLLDEEAPQPTRMSHDGSDGGSEQSHKSKESSVELEDKVENQADDDEDGDGDGDDDNDNEEEDEEAPGGKEDESKSAIKWTEDDEKNLMDLGTSELERNQRLESLITRRRARRNFRLVAEKNLIDFDDADLPLNIPAISTTRRNPFDLPYDDVPGSAPSVLLPRRNPFDLPYDSNEEKPDLKGDSFQHEFSSFQHGEAVFRRHESFSVGPSVLAGPRQERQDPRWKPYFVPGRFATDGTSYHSLQRQLSEVSESKLSSVPDTDSVTSALEEEVRRLNEEDDSQETDMISNVDHASLLVERGSLSSEDIDSLDIERVEKREVHDDGVIITLGHAENHHETNSSLSASGGTTPVEINTSEILLRMGHGEEYNSRSSLSSLSEIDETIADVNKESTRLVPSMMIEGSQILTQTSDNSAFHFMDGMEDNNQQGEPVLEARDGHIGESVISTKSIADSDFCCTRELINANQHMEHVLEPIGDQIGHSVMLQQTSIKSDLQLMSRVADGSHEPVSELKGNHIGEFAISTQTSLDSNVHFTKVALHENQHKEPVYDSSPSSVEKFLSFSSVSSDTRGETSEMGSPSKLAEFLDKEPEVQRSEIMEKDTSGYKEVLEASSQPYSLDESESREDTDISEHNVIKVEATEVDPNFDSKNRFMEPESVIEDISVDLPLSSSDKGSVKEDVACEEKGSHHEWNFLHSSSLDEEIIVKPHQDVIEMEDSASSNHEMASEEINLPAIEEQHPPVVVEHVLADAQESASKADPVQECAIGLEKVLELEENQVSSSSFDGDIYVNGCEAVGQELSLEPSSSERILSIDLNLSEHEERQSSVVVKQVSDANLNTSSSETKHEKEHSFRKEEHHQFEHDEVQSSSLDATVGASLYQDLDLTAVSSGSSYQHVPAEGNSPQKLEKELSWSDKSIVEPSFNNHDDHHEPSITLIESAEEASIGNSVNVLESYEPEEKILINITSLTSKSTLVPPMSLEYKTPDREVVLKDDILDKIVYEDSIGHSNYLAEARESHVAEANVHEDEDDIKEIDEGLLAELDTVGDFSVKEVVGESRHDEQVPENTSNGGPESDFLPKDSSVAEIKMELPVLEVRSAKDIDLAFKQLHEGVDVEEVILPSMIENQLVVEESKYPGETSSHLQAEDRSLEGIHIDKKQVSEDNTEEMSYSKDAPKEVNEVGSTKELPVLEVRTVEDIDLAFKQLHEGVDVEEVILPSMIEQHVVVDKPKDHVHISSDLQVVEARSLEDLHTAMKQVSEDSSKLSDPKDKPAEENEVGSTNEYESRTLAENEAEASSVKNMESSNAAEYEVGSTKISESNSVESGVQDSITIAPHGSKHGIAETSRNSSLAELDAEGKKEKSHSSSEAD